MITLLTKPIPINQKYGVINGRMLLSKKYRDTKDALAWEIRSQWQNKPLTGDVTMNIVQYFGDKRKRDCDAYIKIIMDAGEGILYEDDSQVNELCVTKQIDKESPRIEVSVV